MISYGKILSELKKTKMSVLSKDQQIVKAISLFQDGHDVVAVVDQNSRYEGMIRTHDVISKGINLNATCKTFVDRNIPTILHSDDKELTDFGLIMIEGSTRYLPILDKHSRVIGAINDISLLEALKEKFEELRKYTALDVANWNLISLSPSDTIGTAMAKIREFGFSHIPVISNKGDLEGIVIDRSLLKTQLERKLTEGDLSGKEKDWHRLPVINFATSANTIESDISVLDLYEKFVKFNFHTLIVQKDSDYGLITALDLLKFVLYERMVVPTYDITVMQAPDDNIKAHSIRKTLNLIKREQNWLGSSGNVKIRFKRNLSQSKRGQFSITAMVRLASEKGLVYNAESTDFGAEKTVNEALDNLTRIISDSKRRSLGQKLKKSRKMKIDKFEQGN
ncbi:MAG: CBS domain-containing protein [Candidatus Hodarchaeales archaeon]